MMQRFTWDELYDRAENSAFGSLELKAKDEARYQLGAIIEKEEGYDIEKCESPEEEIDQFLKKHGTGRYLFDDSGNLVSTSTIRFDGHIKELLFQTIELLRKEAQPKFSDWKDADDWLFSELDYTKDELAQIYAGHDVMVSFDSAKDVPSQAEQPRMLLLCEEYENGDGIRSFTVLAVSEDEEMLQKLLAAKVEKDEYGFIAKSNGGDFDNPNHFVTEYMDGEGFVEYYILEENVLSREQLQEMLQTKDYQKIHTYPDNFREVLTNIVEVYAERNHYGHIDTEKAADALMNDDKFYATVILDSWWANGRTLRPDHLKFAQSDISYYLSDVLSENPDFFIDCGAVPRVAYPEGMQDLLVDCIYADAMKHRQPMDYDVAESLATRIMNNADFAKAVGSTLTNLKEQGRTCDANAFSAYCKEFVRHELSPEKPALDAQISGAQFRISGSTPNKSAPDIER